MRPAAEDPRQAELIATDLVQERFVEHSLQLAIQAVLDVASHIVADDQLGEPATNVELFDLLVGASWIADAQRGALRNMAGFRNVLVHEYVRVDLGIVRDVLENHLDELLDFVRAIRAKL